MTIQPTLLGGVDIIFEWGRLGSPGKILPLPHADEGQAIDALKTISATQVFLTYMSVTLNYLAPARPLGVSPRTSVKPALRCG